jgi:uncharacterized protein YecE (DUF72 family)
VDFGRIENISAVDFSLPPDHASTVALLKKLSAKNGKPAKIYLGCAKWGRPDWIGKIYPKGTKAKDFLAHYVKHFNCIELNALFYNLQPKSVIANWAALAADDFKFCPKYTQAITHRRQLKNAEAETDKFIDHMQSFGKKLGPSFIQLSDRFAPNRAEVIRSYLSSLPKDFQSSIEFRHPDWYTENEEVENTFDMMAKQGIGSVITDTAGRRDCLHMRLTTPTAFIRYVGNDLHPTDFKRIDSWVEKIHDWMNKGMKEIYFFIHNHEEVFSPELAKYAAEQFNKVCGTNLIIPPSEQKK